MVNSNPGKINSTALEAENICKSFASKEVLKGISFKVGASDGVCIYGSNASGKTTLLRILAGVLHAYDGTVKIKGWDIKKSTEKTLPMIGVISHTTMMYPQLTVEENLNFFADIYNISDKKERVTEIIENLNLSVFRYDVVSSLSRGTKQRLAIGRAILHKPAVLLADEPFTGLDSKSSKEFIDIINEFKKTGGALVLTSHIIELAAACCEKIAVLADGKLTAQANIGDIDVKSFCEDYQPGAKVKI
ncbi:MAG TPA: heme ABC exporter ATP-binding protein CcmA [Sedimentisphaerales bacterium]|nr:heme ABC exporter ATP-binding protein CcmA [Sedimentisphaerales bacterium]